jgi:UDP-N-acetylmuramyl pentapeptide phosphotransferase/UDP-N-acetylglucosamine-1-phosphate transferase
MTAFLTDLLLPFWPAGLFCFFASVVVVATKTRHLHLTARGHARSEVQSAHVAPTPRIGGIGLFLGLAAVPFVTAFTTPVSVEAASLLMGWLVLSSLPVFLAGLAEDVGIGASPKLRLCGAMVSSGLMILATGYTIQSVGIPGVDAVVALMPVAILFTIFATAGVSHAFNLVDGLNGLSTGIALVVAAALAVIANGVGDMVVAHLAGAVIVVVIGVFLVNFPFGKLFLGDAGAYTLGHVIAWIAVLLMARNPEVSPWAVLLAAFWPVMDTFAAIIRRAVNRTPADAPDKMHFHHVMLRVIHRRIGQGHGLSVANPLATAAMLPLFLTPSVLAVYGATNNALSVVFYIACTLGYIGIRLSMIRKFRHLTRPRHVKSQLRPFGGSRSFDEALNDA